MFETRGYPSGHCNITNIHMKNNNGKHILVYFFHQHESSVVHEQMFDPVETKTFFFNTLSLKNLNNLNSTLSQKIKKIFLYILSLKFFVFLV